MTAHRDIPPDDDLTPPEADRSAATLAPLGSLSEANQDAVVQAWRAEIRTRAAAYRAGQVTAAPWAEVRERLERQSTGCGG
jgi:putative addiction module component (TIGR02574 family)